MGAPNTRGSDGERLTSVRLRSVIRAGGCSATLPAAPCKSSSTCWLPAAGFSPTICTSELSLMPARHKGNTDCRLMSRVKDSVAAGVAAPQAAPCLPSSCKASIS